MAYSVAEACEFISQLRAGDWTCRQHGRIEPVPGHVARSYRDLGRAEGHGEGFAAVLRVRAPGLEPCLVARIADKLISGNPDTALDWAATTPVRDLVTLPG